MMISIGLSFSILAGAADAGEAGIGGACQPRAAYQET
jgi:hypothetical protein